MNPIFSLDTLPRHIVPVHTEAPMPVVPPEGLSFRVATETDIDFLDYLQKVHGKALGYFPTKQFEGYIRDGGVLIAQLRGTRVGYIISRDRYLKRDELGVIYQLCVTDDKQRGMIGAALVQEVFARSAWGCRLYCCWCAKDLPANNFWQAMGFVPVAFRNGGGAKGKRRVHIFWQKRICSGDESTPFWYPFQTAQGALRADRMVFPVMPGVRWQDVEEVDVPTVPLSDEEAAKRPAKAKFMGQRIVKQQVCIGGRLRWVERRLDPAVSYEAEIIERLDKQKPPRRPAAKVDPDFASKNREFRDKYLTVANRDLLPGLAAGKYEAARLLGPGRQGDHASGSAVIAPRRVESRILPAA